MYDEEPDILSSFITRNIVEVRSLSQDEEAETGQSKFAFIVEFKSAEKKSSIVHTSVPSRILLKCETSGKYILSVNI